MLTGKLFENGRSQAVRLPKECRFSGTEVTIKKIGELVLLMPADHAWDDFRNSINMFSEDFMQYGRQEQPEQERESL